LPVMAVTGLTWPAIAGLTQTDGRDCHALSEVLRDQLG
jgi:hypothetical protein